jgi:putative addiction module component (TIGR02574 family)
MPEFAELFVSFMAPGFLGLGLLARHADANDKDLRMSSSAVRTIIALASELSDDERRVVIDTIAPKESIASLAQEWEAEIARRAARVQAGQSQGKPAEQVFDRLESKLKGRSMVLTPFLRSGA